MRRLKYTALHRAVLDCRAAQVRLLLQQCGADVNSRDLHGRTPLMLCCALDNQRVAMTMARLLLAANPDLGVKDELGRTALAHACLFGREALVVRMAESGVIDPTEPDNDGCAPLHHAAVQGNSRIVCLLVRACAEGRSNVDCQNRLGCTPLMLACRLRRYHCALFLLLDGGASGFLRDNAHFLSSLEWLRTRWEPAAEQPPLRRAETAPMLQQPQQQQPPTFLTEYSSLGGRPRGPARARTTVGGGFFEEWRRRPPPPPLPAAAGSRPTTVGSAASSGQRSRYTSATGDTVYVDVDELSARDARSLLAERLRAQALEFPYPTAKATTTTTKAKAATTTRPTTRDLQALRQPPRSSAVANACQLLGLYHAAMTAPKPAQALLAAEMQQREGTGISDLTVGGSASEAAAAAATGAAADEKSGHQPSGGRDRRASLLTEASARDKKSVKFKDVSK